jgi:hypothetical protein
MVNTIPETNVLILSGSRETNIDDRNEMFDIQHEKNKPLVFMRRKRKYAYVEADFVTCYPQHLTKSAYKESLHLMKKYWKIGSHNINNNRTVEFSTKPEVLSLKDLTVSQARLYAQELDSIIMNEENLANDSNYNFKDIRKEVYFI